MAAPYFTAAAAGRSMRGGVRVAVSMTVVMISRIWRETRGCKARLTTLPVGDCAVDLLHPDHRARGRRSGQTGVTAQARGLRALEHHAPRMRRVAPQPLTPRAPSLMRLRSLSEHPSMEARGPTRAGRRELLNSTWVGVTCSPSSAASAARLPGAAFAMAGCRVRCS